MMFPIDDTHDPALKSWVAGADGHPEFPVQNLLIVGTELNRVERITGRLTWGRVALGGILSGVWLGLFVGLIFSFFVDEDVLAMIVATVLLGAVFGLVWALIGYAFTRGQRDFSSITQVVATKYEVLVEHKVAAQARELLGSTRKFTVPLLQHLHARGETQRRADLHVFAPSCPPGGE